MKIEETKEIKEILPSYLRYCVKILEKHRKIGHFSAWSVGNADYFISVYTADEALSQHLTTSLTPSKNSDAIGLHPYFDLASLTKPLFFNALLRHKWKDNFQKLVLKSLDRFTWFKNSWNEDLIKFVSENQILNLNTFLSHKSSFTYWVWCKFFISIRKYTNIKNNFLHFLLKNYNKNSVAVYSDLNYMFLSLLIESLFNIKDWGKQLDSLNKKQNTNFFHASINPEKTTFAIPSYPYTSIHIFDTSESNTNSFGFVHDTNANLLSALSQNERIVSGHAGLYGNIFDVYKGITCIAQTQQNITTDNQKDKFIYGLNHKKTKRTIKFGHFGYTGTSFWFKYQKTLKKPLENFILLTNRTSSRNSKLKYPVPEVCIITDLKKNKEYYFFIEKNKIESVSQHDFLKKSKKIFHGIKKIWNNSIIPEYYNLTELRSKLEKKFF